MRHSIQFSLAVSYLLLCISPSNIIAHPVDDQRQPDKVEIILLADITLTPPRDDDMITMGGLKGPKETKGIASIDPMGIIDLGEEFPAMSGRQMRARIFTIEPGGVVGIHTHEQRPGYAFIISGKIMEHRNDHLEPLVRNAGDIAIEKAGVTHWWENTFAEPVKALVVDIFTPE
jgi:quercetin dioxygenase-like cupin family protein